MVKTTGGIKALAVVTAKVSARTDDRKTTSSRPTLQRHRYWCVFDRLPLIDRGVQQCRAYAMLCRT